MTEKGISIPGEFVAAITECASLINEEVIPVTRDLKDFDEPLPSLLDECRSLLHKDFSQPEPIRIIHHLACTGGTLISKCLASMPNTQLLSEVEPHSQIPRLRASKFCPTDLISLVRYSSRGTSTDLETAIFLGGLDAIYSDCSKKGIRLILRDHSHSKYCMDESVSTAPSLSNVVSKKYQTLGILTVRHPLDSFLSLQHNAWMHFNPATLHEYSNRYLAFLDDKGNLPQHKYEDFVLEPELVAKNICRDLALPYNEDFINVFGAHSFSGNSGRVSNFIGYRSRRQVTDAVRSEITDSDAFRELCERLDYDIEI